MKSMKNGMVNTTRKYAIERLPYEEDLQRYALSYIPEKFTPEEERFLKPFFTNVDKPVFAAQNLPEEVIGALSSRYSRSTISLRRLFLKEYVEPIIYPERQKDWVHQSRFQQAQAQTTREQFLNFVETWHNAGGLDHIVNVQRGRKFFQTWLAQYGDDSIAELGGAHLCIEGLSMIATKELQDKRIGLSPLEKSTRYVQYWEKRLDGEYQYMIPGEIRHSDLKKPYRDAMDYLFDTYTRIAEPYLEYIQQRYPKGNDETDKSFMNSRSAKRFDDIRDILPFSTQTNVAFFGNGRAFEDLISRCLDHPLGELRWLGQAMINELRNVPSFIERAKTQRGAEVQIYRGNLHRLRQELVDEFISPRTTDGKVVKWVSLLSYTPDADVEVISSFLFSNAYGATLEELRRDVAKMPVAKRKKILERILEERRLGKDDPLRQEVRFRKVPRAFENAEYLFEIWGRGGDYRDLHRHRMLTQDRQPFTTQWGYDLEKDVLESPFVEQIKAALEQANNVYRQLVNDISPLVAQYAVPFAYLQHWYMRMTAREVYWMVELRTGPQGRPHYRKICQQIGKLASKASPAVFQGLMTDWGDYALSRRESEKKIEKKLEALEKEIKIAH